MTKIMAVLVWPVGIAIILCAGGLLARHTPLTAPGSGPRRPLPPVGRHGAPSPVRSFRSVSMGRGTAQFLLVIFAGTLVIYAVMVLLGLIVIHAGPTIDKPIFHWTITHRFHSWRAFMVRATELGDKYPTWAAATTAAVCMAVTWRKNRWLPPVALGSLMVADHFLTLAINHTVTRRPPPGTGGIFPSGGSDRAIVFYGLIAYLLWREFSGQRRTAILAGAVVAACGFEEGYSRVYLAVHWTTDVFSGWLFGCLQLAVFILAVRMVAGPAEVRAATAPLVSDIPASPMRAPAREVST